MGKKQHQKDKLYLTSTEWTTLYGGRRANDEYHTHGERSEFKRLPFDHCSLSLQPFKDPYCTVDGVIYDLFMLVPFLQKYGIDPFSGEKLQTKQLVKLNFHKNKDDHYHCPVLFKVFNQNTHIVAIKTTGNVYSYEAVEQLNLKANHLFDLLNDQPFSKTDIIEIQNPLKLDKFNITNFYYVKNNLKLQDGEASTSNLRIVNNETKETLQELSTVEENEFLKGLAQIQKGAKNINLKGADKFNSAHYSTGRAAASFTSTVMEPVLTVDAARIDEYSIRYPYIKKKGFLRFLTNFGCLNIELYCDKVPRTCDNFMTLCKRDYYKGVKFHRLIKHFMIQGGDPTGTGRGGESAFGGAPFTDEFCNQYSHEGRGVLSMANTGPNTNKSQFFITFRSCKHLDNKHTIFGRVVGGMETLTKMENVKTDSKDRPLEDIVILQIIIYFDPYREAEQMIANERKKMQTNIMNQEYVPKQQVNKVYRKGIGSFINLDEIHNKLEDGSENGPKTKKAKTTDNDPSRNIRNMLNLFDGTKLLNKSIQNQKNEKNEKIDKLADFLQQNPSQERAHSFF